MEALQLHADYIQLWDISIITHWTVYFGSLCNAMNVVNQLYALIFSCREGSTILFWKLANAALKILMPTTSNNILLPWNLAKE